MLLLATWYVTLLAVLFAFVCVLMMLVILIQKPRGGGLSGAFGGAGGSAQSAFGAKTGDFLTWLTVGFFVVFLIIAVLLTWLIPQNTVVPVPVAAPANSSSSTGTGSSTATPSVPPVPAEEAPPAPATTSPASGGGGKP